jgi:hypothetical protein
MKGADDAEDQDDPWAIAWEDIEMQGKEIGRGQFGAVFHGLLFGSEVAVKKLLKLTEAEADTKYMKREQELLRQLAHPNICLFIGLCAHEGDLWLVSEYVANGCLSKLLYDTAQPLTWSRRVRFALDVTQALAFIHSKQLMHRDVKAENLLLDKSDKVKVCDFGFARKVDKKQQKMTKKAAVMTIAGTDEWMAPEVIVGTPYGQPADIFSFGVTLTEMILRKKPEERHPRNAFDFEVEEFKQALPADCPPEFAGLVLECCKYEPSQRPEAKVMVRGLKELFKVVSDREQQQQPPPSVVQPQQRSPPPQQKQLPAEIPKLVVPIAVLPALVIAAPLSPTALLVSSNGGARFADLGLGAGPYIGLTPSADDEAAASPMPNESGMFRAIALSGGSAREGRPRWLLFQDATPSEHEGWLKVAFGESGKSAKLYCLLLGGIVYYFKNNKKGEKNVGRLLLDAQLEAGPLQEKGKKSELTLMTGHKQTVRLLGPAEELKTWAAKCKEHRLVDLDLTACMHPTSPVGLTATTRDPNSASFPVRFGAAAATLLLCVDREGIKLLQAFLEETLLEMPWNVVGKWQISRNDVIQLFVTPAGAKKPLEMEFACLAWATASKVFEVLEMFSKEGGVGTKKSSLTSPDKPLKRGSGRK